MGSKIWSDRSYTISNMSEKLVGTTLFQTKHYVRRATIEVSSNRNAFVLIALYEEGNREGGLVDSLQSDGWTLKEGWFVEWSNTYKLNNIFSKIINAGTKVQFTSTRKDMTFAIFAYEGK